MSDRNRCHIYSLYWAATTPAPYQACAIFNPVLSDIDVNSVGYLDVGTLESSTHTLEAYIIEWRIGSYTGEVLLTTGNSGNTDSRIERYHPILYPIQAGEYFPVIISLTVDGETYTLDGSGDTKYTPDLLECLDSIIVYPYSCSLGQNPTGAYTHTIIYTYDRVEPSVEDAEQSITFYPIDDLGNPALYVAVNLVGATVADKFDFYYVSGSTQTLIESIILGLDPIGGSNFTTMPYIISYGTGYATLLNLTNISYTEGDYILINITPSYNNPTNPNTLWRVYFACVYDEMSCELFDPLWQEIDPCSIRMEKVGCDYRVYFNTLAEFVLDQNIRDYVYRNSIRLTDTETVAGTTNEFYTSLQFVTEGYLYSNPVSPACASMQLSDTMTIIKAHPYLTYKFTNESDYLFAKNHLEYLEAYMLNVGQGYTTIYEEYSGDSTQDNYYRFYRMRMYLQDTCGDVHDIVFGNFHVSSIIDYQGYVGVNDYRIVVTPKQITNDFPTSTDPCVTTYDDLNSHFTSSSAGNNINSAYTMADGTWTTKTFYIMSGYMFKEYLLAETTKNSYHAATFFRRALDNICDNVNLGGYNCISSTANYYTFYAFYINVVITDPNDPINNFEVYSKLDEDGCYDSANNTLIYSISGGVRTEPPMGECEDDVVEPETDYGFLYNWWAAIGDTDGDNVADTSIANTGWHLPTEAEVDTLLNYLGGIEELGSTPEEEVATCLSLQSVGATYWDNGGNNSSGMDMRGCGGRAYSSGVFHDLDKYSYFFTSTIKGSYHRSYSIIDSNSTVSRALGYKKHGRNVRLIKDSTTLTNGQVGTYTGNNGITYPTICIGTQEWLAKDLEETKFRDGSDIPYIGNEEEDNATWAAATSAAYCIYPIT